MKVLIVGSSKLPIPAVKGGAVPNLIEQLIRQNEQDGKVELSCCSLYDPEAVAESEKYKKTEFIWAKQPALIRWMDKAVYFILSKVLRMKRLLSLSYLFQIVWMSLFVAGVLRKGDYDRVIFENALPVLFSMKLWGNKKKYAGKYHLHMHSIPRGFYGNAKIVNACKSIICISRYVADEMLKDPRLNIDESKIEIMFNCIDTQLFRPDCGSNTDLIREKRNIGPDKKIVMFIGRLCKEKGIAELLQAIKLMKRDDIVLLVVGANFYKSGIKSPYEEYLHSLVADISEKVVFTGYIDYSDTPQYYAAADVVALPAIWEEPAGMTTVEAMACCRPVVSTISGGIPEYVGEGNCVLLERNDDLIPQLAKTIEALLEDGETANRLAQNAALRAAGYNMEYYYSQFLQILGLQEK